MAVRVIIIVPCLTWAARSAADQEVNVQVVLAHRVANAVPATGMLLRSVSDLATGPDGSIVLVDSDNHCVRQIDPTGVVATILTPEDVGGDVGAVWGPTSVAIDAQTRAIYVADQSTNRVWKVEDGAAVPFAGTGAAGFGGDGTAATGAMLRLPSDLAVGGDGTVYIADYGNHRIRAVGTDGVMRTVAGSLPPDIDSHAALGDGSLFLPGLVALGAGSSLLVVDRKGRRLQRLLADGTVQLLPSIPSNITAIAVTDDYRLVVAAPNLLELQDASWSSLVAGSDRRRLKPVAAAGQDLIAYDWRGRRVVHIGPGGAYSDVIANHSTAVQRDEPSSAAAGFACHDVVVSNSGGIFFSDPPNQRVALIEGSGTVRTYAGGPSPGELEPSAVFSRPAGVALAQDGSLFVADAGFNRVVKIDPDGVVTIAAGSGKEGFSGDGGLAVEAMLDRPTDVAIGVDGSVYIADSDNLRIRRVDPSGLIVTVAQLQQEAGRYEKPERLLTLPDGSLLVTTEYPERVIRVTPDGEQTEFSLNAATSDGVSTAFAADGDGRIAVRDRERLVIGAIDVDTLEPEVAFHLTDLVRHPSAITAVAFAPGGGLILCDSTGRRILRVEPIGE